MGIFSAVRRALVAIRDAMDGRLHPGRSSRARARLAELQPRSVLFVCLGNICRSPYAEHVFRSDADSAIGAASAGFILPGRQPPENALEAASSRGVEATVDHRSQVVSPELLRAADALFIFDRFNLRRLRTETDADLDRVFWLGDFDTEWTGKRAIIDPWGKPIEEFHATFERIERCVAEVVEVIDGTGRAPATDGTP